MARYQFYLEKFRITDTRSHHKDTLIAGFAVAVNSTIYGPLCAKLGDFNNGEYNFWEYGLGAIDNISITAADHVLFVYGIYNNGNESFGDAVALSMRLRSELLEATKRKVNIKSSRNVPPGEKKSDYYYSDPVEGDDYADDFWTGEDGSGGDPTLVRNIFTGGLYSLVNYALTDCDGTVAYSSYSSTGKALQNSLSASPKQVLQLVKTTNAKQQKLGTPCNSSGSNYITTAIIQHQA